MCCILTLHTFNMVVNKTHFRQRCRLFIYLCTFKAKDDNYHAIRRLRRDTSRNITKVYHHLIVLSTFIFFLLCLCKYHGRFLAFCGINFPVLFVLFFIFFVVRFFNTTILITENQNLRRPNNHNQQPPSP